MGVGEPGRLVSRPVLFLRAVVSEPITISGSCADDLKPVRNGMSGQRNKLTQRREPDKKGIWESDMVSDKSDPADTCKRSKPANQTSILLIQPTTCRAKASKARLDGPLFRCLMSDHDIRQKDDLPVKGTGSVCACF